MLFEIAVNSIAMTVKYSVTAIKFNYVLRIGLDYCGDCVLLMECCPANDNTTFRIDTISS